MKLKTLLIGLLLLLSACNLAPTIQPSATPLPPVLTPLPPTSTPLPPTPTLERATLSATDIPQPSATPIPGAYLLIQSNSIVLGGVLNGAWLSPQQAAAAVPDPVAYRFYTLQAETGLVQGSQPEAREAPPCYGSYDLTLDPQPDYFDRVGLSSPWDSAPRTAQEATLSADESAALESLLQQNGTNQAAYQQVSAYRVDLEGDGSEETIITATALQEGSLHMVSPGEYSLAAVLRTNPEGRLVASLLVGDFYTAEEMAFPSAYEISSILDLNGDGAMEVVVHGRHWEGNLLIVFDFESGSPQRVLDTCCAEEASIDQRCVSP